jgi:hypothetical protein
MTFGLAEQFGDDVQVHRQDALVHAQGVQSVCDGVQFGKSRRRVRVRAQRSLKAPAPVRRHPEPALQEITLVRECRTLEADLGDARPRQVEQMRETPPFQSNISTAEANTAARRGSAPCAPRPAAKGAGMPATSPRTCAMAWMTGARRRLA